MTHLKARITRPRAMSLCIALAAALLLLCAVIAAHAQRGDAEDAKSWYALRLRTGEALSLGFEHLWSSGASLRTEFVLGGRPYLTLVHRGRYIVIDKLAGTGASVERHENARRAKASPGRPFGFGDELETLVDAGGEYVGDETVQSGRCRLHRLTSQVGRQEVCVQEEGHGLPLYIKHWNRESNREEQVNYLSWIPDFEAGSDFFAPDPRVKLQEYSYDDYAQGKVREPVLYPRLIYGPREKP